MPSTRDYDLRWLYVRKTVAGRPAVQLERLYHHVTWSQPTTFLEVPRTGPRGRFFPIKEPADLESSRAVAPGDAGRLRSWTEPPSRRHEVGTKPAQSRHDVAT